MATLAKIVKTIDCNLTDDELTGLLITTGLFESLKIGVAGEIIVDRHFLTLLKEYEQKLMNQTQLTVKTVSNAGMVGKRVYQAVFCLWYWLDYEMVDHDEVRIVTAG